MKRRTSLASIAMAAIVLAGCARAVTASHADAAYRGKLEDDTMVEASTTMLITTKDVVIAVDCRPIQDALAKGDAAAVDRFIARGMAARLPAKVSLYTPPFSPVNPKTMPFVVTDNRYGGRLCTPDSFDVVKTP